MNIEELALGCKALSNWVPQPKIMCTHHDHLPILDLPHKLCLFAVPLLNMQKFVSIQCKHRLQWDWKSLYAHTVAKHLLEYLWCIGLQAFISELLAAIYWILLCNVCIIAFINQYPMSFSGCQKSLMSNTNLYFPVVGSGLLKLFPEFEWNLCILEGT